MKKSLLIASVLFFAGCQASLVQNGGILGVTPEDQLTKTGMIRTTYDKDISGNQYLMGSSQQTGDVDKGALFAGPVKECLQENGRKADKCFENFFAEKTERDGPEAAFSDLKVLYGASAEVRAYCHPLSHVIGHAAVEKYPDVNEAYKHGSDFCWSGYYHGVMEEIMDDIGRDNLPHEINNICGKMPGKENYSFDYYNCVHGMGHGLMDVMGDNLQNALKMCDNMTGWWEQQSCFSGVFMQNVINDGLEYHTADLKPEDTVYPCNVVDQKYKDQCYLMQTSYMLKINHYDFVKTFDICAGVDKGFSVTCYRSLGRDASGSTVSDLEKTRAICLSGKDYTQQSECFVGAVKDFVSYHHNDEKAKKLCESLEDQKMRQYCLDTVKEYYKTF